MHQYPIFLLVTFIQIPTKISSVFKANMKTGTKLGASAKRTTVEFGRVLFFNAHPACCIQALWARGEPESSQY